MEPIVYFVEEYPKEEERVIRSFIEITGITSLYNLRNVAIDGEFYLRSSIFSDLKVLKDVASLSSSKNPIVLKHPLESVIQDKEVSINYLRQKRFTIELFLLRNDGILSENSVAEEPNTDTPKYCQEKCKFCKTKCNFTLKRLENAGQKLINEELVRHSHPSSRAIKEKHRLRNTKEAKLELISHYKYIHFKETS